MKKLYYILLILLLGWGCQQKTPSALPNPLETKFDSLNLENKVLNRQIFHLGQENDSLQRLLQMCRFYQDSCIVKGKIKVEYHLLGAPNRGEKYPTEKEVLQKNEYIKLVILNYKTKKPLKSIIVKPDKNGNFNYTMKLKKNTPYRNMLFAKRKNQQKLKDENTMWGPNHSFRTESKDTMHLNFYLIRYRT